MQFGRFKFSPPWWAVLVFGLVLALLVTLGTWQLQRGQFKEAIIAERAAAGKMPPLDFADAQNLRGGGRRVVVTGRYLPQKQLLLDNQIWQGRPGYRVWTPLQIKDGSLVMVDRGWVALGADRADPPNPAAETEAQRIVGLWRDWPQPGLSFAAPACSVAGSWPRVVLYPPYAQVACNYETPVNDGLLLLEEAASGGFPRDWQDVGLPPVRHYGYALQWYALALALCVIFIVMNTRRQNDHGNDPHEL